MAIPGELKGADGTSSGQFVATGQAAAALAEGDHLPFPAGGLHFED